MKNRISAFLSLPLSSIDEFTLTHRLRDIGRLEGTSATREEA